VTTTQIGGGLTHDSATTAALRKGGRRFVDRGPDTPVAGLGSAPGSG